MLFLSYSREDGKRVAELAATLQQNGWKIWMDLESIAGGSEWREKIGQGISEATAVVFNVSPSACSSDYVRKEVFFAIRHQKPIVPVMIGNSKAVELPYALELELGHLHFLRWPDDGVQKILAAVQQPAGGGAGPAEDFGIQKVRELMESGNPALVSLSKDFVAFRRLVQSDPEMAVLRAFRIACRALTYLGQGLSVGGQGERRNPELVLEHLVQEGLVGKSSAAGVLGILEIGRGFSLDEFLSSPEQSAGLPSSGEAALCGESLMDLLQAMLSVAKNPRRISEITTTLKVVRGSRASREMIQQAFMVGQRTFGKEVMPSFAGMERMHAANPDVYNLLVEESTGICIGYTSVVPLDQEGLEATLKPDFDHINPADILRYDFPGFYFVHLSSIAVDPAYRDVSQAYGILTNTLAGDFLELMGRDIFIVGMSADAITANGHRICRSLGMTPVARREGESTLFYGSLMPPTMRLASGSGIQLLKACKIAFAELAEVCPKIERVHA